MRPGKGISSAPPEPRNKGKGKGKGKDKFGGFSTPGYAGLNDQQAAIINQTQGQDFSLGGYAQGQLGNIEQAYNQPFDWNGLPTQPVQGDFNNWRQEQIDANYDLYAQDMDPEFQRELLDFEETAMQRGWTPGSNVYEREKSRIESRQARDRQAAKTGAINLSGQTAGQFYDIGTAARGNALSEGMMQRNMPLNEFNALRDAQSGMGIQNLGYAQARGLADQAYQHQLGVIRNTPRGGGGGGGGSPALWQQYGFSSPMEYDAYKTQQARDNALWDYSNNPQYRQPSSPSYGSQIGGQILGTGLGLLGMYAGKNWF